VKSTSTTIDTDQNAETDTTGHRERHAQAIAKIMAKKEEHTIENETPAAASAESAAAAVDVPSLTIHLILTSSPASPRIELSIPTNASAAVLLRRVSQASGVPGAELKLIFRGRIITESGNSASSSRGGVVEEFGIEDGCALHVVGKPRQPKEKEEDGDSGEEGHHSNIGGDEDGGSEEEEGDDDSYEENGTDSDAAVVAPPLSDTQTRAQLVAAIQNTSGEGHYHRLAQRGDLTALRRAVDDGFSDLIRVADSNGWTPLHEAVRAGHAEVVGYLVEEAGLDVNVFTNGGGEGAVGWSAITLALDHHGNDHPVTMVVMRLLRGSGDAPANPWQG